MLKNKEPFYIALCIFSLLLMRCVCVRDFEDIQVICRAYPAEYPLWQYAPVADVVSELKYVKNCQEYQGFANSFTEQWSLFNEDSVRFCVDCSTLADDCPRLTTCP